MSLKTLSNPFVRFHSSKSQFTIYSRFVRFIFKNRRLYFSRLKSSPELTYFSSTLVFTYFNSPFVASSLLSPSLKSGKISLLFSFPFAYSDHFHRFSSYLPASTGRTFGETYLLVFFPVRALALCMAIRYTTTSTTFHGGFLATG